MRALTILKEECDAGFALACAAYGQVKIEAGEASAGFALVSIPRVNVPAD